MKATPIQNKHVPPKSRKDDSSQTCASAATAATAKESSKQVFFREYEVLRKVGNGSYGQVFKARHAETGEVVAIKKVSLDKKNYYLTKQTLREVAILRQLSGMKGSERHIARLLDAWEEDDAIYLVLEYYSLTLKKLLDKAYKLQLEDEDVTKMAHSLLSALRFLHSAGVMHRDIKPANLLVDKDFGIRICDFGLSRVMPKIGNDLFQEGSLEEKIADRKRSLSNHICSRYYRPPEIILLEKQYSAPVDIWSAGCILLEAVSSTKKYAGKETKKDQRVAFKGSCCHPLTPPPSGDAAPPKDQLKMILEVLGKQTKRDVSFISRSDCVEYVAELQEDCEPHKVNFKFEFEQTNPLLAELLGPMLEFNPSLRMTAEELLRFEVFQGINEKSEEQLAAAKNAKMVSVQADTDDDFDYFLGEPTKLGVSHLLKMMDNEIALIQKMKS